MATRTPADVSLNPGDHLTREEFHRRYSARPDIKKAELINGVVYVPSPVRSRFHGRPHGLVVTWLGVYASRTPGLMLEDCTTVYLDEHGEVQPDAFLWRPEDGTAHETDESYVEGAPQFIVEVAASSASYDLGEKKEAYRRNGVREYVVWRVIDKAIDWFELRDGIYVLRGPDQNGIVESSQFPGLRLHIPSMLAGDAAGVLAALDVTGFG